MFAFKKVCPSGPKSLSKSSGAPGGTHWYLQGSRHEERDIPGSLGTAHNNTATGRPLQHWPADLHRPAHFIPPPPHSRSSLGALDHTQNKTNVSEHSTFPWTFYRIPRNWSVPSSYHIAWLRFSLCSSRWWEIKTDDLQQGLVVLEQLSHLLTPWTWTSLSATLKPGFLISKMRPNYASESLWSIKGANIVKKFCKSWTHTVKLVVIIKSYYYIWLICRQFTCKAPPCHWCLESSLRIRGL